MIQRWEIFTPVCEYSTEAGKNAAVEWLASCLVSGGYRVQISSQRSAVLIVITFLLSPFRQKQGGAPQMGPLQLPSAPFQTQ
jgi:hypothetical protein